MIQLHTLDSLARVPELRETMFKDRKTQFMDRLGWSLNSSNDESESDQFDTSNANYIIYTNNALDHLGSLRIMNCGKSCMIREIFNDDFPEAREFSTDTLEFTRFCVSPRLDPRKKQEVSQTILRAAYLYGLEKQNAKQLFGICYASLLRIYNRSGLPPNSFTNGKLDSQLILARWDIRPLQVYSMYHARSYQAKAG